MSNSRSDLTARQRLRMQRFGMSVSLYLLWAILTIGAWLAGLIVFHLPLAVGMGAGVVATILGFWLMFATGANLRFRDPSLTLAQCAIGLGWLMLLMYVVPEWRDLLMFGTFQLRPRQFVALSFAAFAGYVTMSGIDLAIGFGNETAARWLFRCAVVGSLMVWCAYFGIQLGALREKLSRRNEQLEELVREVSHLAERDDLTQAFNRRWFVTE